MHSPEWGVISSEIERGDSDTTMRATISG
eukprot:SAG11_NODE_8415_length_1018_cov_1.057671_1_plen_28_part_10